jgi:hypothetical protein
VPRATTFGIILLVLFALQLSSAQQQLPLPPIAPPGQQPDSGPNLPTDMRKRMEKEANKQRQAELKRDTDKLLKLSTELKQYVDKSNENILSMDVVKKADEIEKLAHNVKIKMRGDNYSPAVASPTTP